MILSTWYPTYPTGQTSKTAPVVGHCNRPTSHTAWHPPVHCEGYPGNPADTRDQTANQSDNMHTASSIDVDATLYQPTECYVHLADNIRKQQAFIRHAQPLLPLSPLKDLKQLQHAYAGVDQLAGLAHAANDEPEHCVTDQTKTNVKAQKQETTSEERVPVFVMLPLDTVGGAMLVQCCQSTCHQRYLQLALL